jgi:Domain of unknown function (DUF1741)
LVCITPSIAHVIKSYVHWIWTDPSIISTVGYHWSHLWQVLLGLVRFLISHYERIAAEGDVDELLQLVSNLTEFFSNEYIANAYQRYFIIERHDYQYVHCP